MTDSGSPVQVDRKVALYMATLLVDDLSSRGLHASNRPLDKGNVAELLVGLANMLEKQPDSELSMTAASLYTLAGALKDDRKEALEEHFRISCNFAEFMIKSQVT